jgi:putative addiction module component (TIGR02574 family)
MLAKQGKKHKVRGVPMTVEQILAETNGWPEEQVEKLFERLLMSNYRLPDPAVDAAWAEEIKRRIDDIESGREVGIPGEEVMARMRKIVGL